MTLQQDTVQYSELVAFNDAYPVSKESAVVEFVKKLTHHTPTPDKSSMPMFNGTVFDGGRRKEHAVESHLLIIDYDNETTIDDPNNPGKKLKRQVVNPVSYDAVKAVLEASKLRSVIVTSHNHSAALPKFRVVIFLGEPVSPSNYPYAFTQLLAQTGLASPVFTGGMDPSSNQPTRFFYLPSYSAENLHLKRADYLEGEWFYFDPSSAVLPKPGPGRPKGDRQTHPGHFSDSQIDRYYRYALNGLHHTMTDKGAEFAGPCPIHGGEKSNFGWNKFTGHWHCFSQCSANGIKGGGIYAFHQIYRNKLLADQGYPPIDWRTARNEVHQAVGLPTPASTEHFQHQLTFSDASQVPQLLQNINALPVAERAAAVTAVLNQHKVEQALVQEHVVLDPQVPQATAVNPYTAAPTNGPTGGQLNSALLLDKDRRANRIWTEFSTRVDLEKYDLDFTGTYRIQPVGAGEKRTFERRAIAPQPIWISAVGRDPVRNDEWVRLHWAVPGREPQARWMRTAALRAGEFTQLDSFPYDKARSYQITEYLNDATASILEFIPAPLVSKMGWQIYSPPEPGAPTPSPRLVLYHDTNPDVLVVTEPILTRKGEVDAWLDLIAWLANDESFEDWRMLWVVLGASVASPLVRFFPMRNPVFLLAGESSSGKTTTANLGTAVWTNPVTALVSADSTIAGAEMKIQLFQDLPLTLDEFQRYFKKGIDTAETLIYSLGNGMSRIKVDVSKNTTMGGEVRRGMTYLTSEEDCISQLAGGAQNRLIRLVGKPIPDLNRSNRLSHLYSHHHGVLGVLVEDYVNRNLASLIMDIRLWHARKEPLKLSVSGDDLYTIALVVAGLQVIEGVSKIKVPVGKVVEYLLQCLKPTREMSINDKTDAIDRCFIELIEKFNNSPFDNGGYAGVANMPEGAVAYRGPQLMYPGDAVLEIASSSRMLIDTLKTHNMYSNAGRGILAEWLNRGYLLRHPDPNRKNAPYKLQRTNTIGNPQFQGEKSFVHCITPKGYAMASGDRSDHRDL